ncbi:MAG: hypothetical protein IPO19_09350 [Rhodoferax sp.]|nr:hypothetical protein [Rhodoferax sp.]
MSALPLPVSALGAAAVWRADELARPPGLVLATGHALLDSQLPGGGWPVGALVEILQAQSGQNEWRLLLPALKRRSAGPVVMVGAPHVPFGPGLAAQGAGLAKPVVDHQRRAGSAHVGLRAGLALCAGLGGAGLAAPGPL